MVFNCLPIWNHKIDVKERHPEAKAKGWLKIKKDFTEYIYGLETEIDISKIKVEMLKNTWNLIRENYVRYKNETTLQSGSEAKEVDPPEHSDIMRTYDDMIAKRK